MKGGETMTREEAIYLLKNTAWIAPSLEPVDEAITMATEALENERPKGHWDFIGNNLFRCTECGVLYDYSQLEQLKIYITDSAFPSYCPKCGADMRGENDE